MDDVEAADADEADEADGCEELKEGAGDEDVVDEAGAVVVEVDADDVDGDEAGADEDAGGQRATNLLTGNGGKNMTVKLHRNRMTRS